MKLLFRVFHFNLAGIALASLYIYKIALNKSKGIKTPFYILGNTVLFERKIKKTSVTASLNINRILVKHTLITKVKIIERSVIRQKTFCLYSCVSQYFVTIGTGNIEIEVRVKCNTAWGAECRCTACTTSNNYESGC